MQDILTASQEMTKLYDLHEKEEKIIEDIGEEDLDLIDTSKLDNEILSLVDHNYDCLKRVRHDKETRVPFAGEEDSGEK